MSIVNRRMANIFVIATLIQSAAKIENEKDQRKEIAKLDRQLKAAYIYLDQAVRGESGANELP